MPGRHLGSKRRLQLIGGPLVVAAIALPLTLVLLRAEPPATTTTAGPATSTTPLPPASSTTSPAASTTSSTVLERERGSVPGWTVGQPWGTTVGLTMFRGNPTRTFYGTGPLPITPGVLWSFPSEGGMCGSSAVGAESKLWCGTGWTGQPVIWEKADGSTEIIFGAYDKAVHFLDGATGAELRSPFPVGDIIKGSVTLDPDGYPLLYFGSRDDKLRIVALDRDEPTELWFLEASSVQGIWNNDWDGNPVVIDDVLYEGGENGWFFAVRLNRHYDAAGMVVVTPAVVFQERGWNDDLLAKVGPNVSIESSVSVFGHTAFFANSGGRVAGFDVARVLEGVAPLAFDYWVGDDTDATVVIDGEGFLYVAVEEERKNARSKELGQLIKLDPLSPDPFVWGLAVPGGQGDGGLWATPAVAAGMIYATTNTGELMAVDGESGEVTWREEVGWHAWSSPVVIEDQLLVATCLGELRAYSLADPAHPRALWNLKLSESCIESTPAVWNGRIYVGSRDGRFYAVG